ncbi:dynein heavy chain domain-containing protein 1 [Thomomys bottae]
MKPHEQTHHSPLPFTPTALKPGEDQQQRAWDWQLNPELWARSLRQQLNVHLLYLEREKKVREFPDGSSSDTHKSRFSTKQPRATKKKRRQFLKEIETSTLLELLYAEIRALFSAVLQDGSAAAWRYLHAVLGLLPPYRELLANCLDLLPLLEQLYCWAPRVLVQVQLDLLDAINKAFPPDMSLLYRASHVDCSPLKKRFHQESPCPACPFMQARWGGKQEKKDLATWSRPLTLPEFQHCLGIVGAQVALGETHWLDGLSLLPLALATDIPVQYESTDTDYTGSHFERKQTKSQVDNEIPPKSLPKESPGILHELSFPGSQVMAVMKTEKSLRTMHFLYLNVAPSRHFKPYDLIVVPQNQVNPEHYIFSPFGVLYVHPLDGCEVMTLGTWHRHSVLWYLLQFIPFFKYCLLRKAFTCWKKNVKLLALHQLQTFLGTQLLLAVPHFGAGLLHISRLLQELHTVSWLPKDQNRCYELLDLRRALAREKYRALRLLRYFLNLCKSILQLIHEDTYQMQHGLQERVENCKKLRSIQGSLYLHKVLLQQLQQKLSQTETWLLQLGSLHRLVNFMICQSVVSILEDEITSFVTSIIQAPREKPFLWSRLIFNAHRQLTPMPPIENIIHSLTEGVQSIKTSALQVIQSSDLKTSEDFLCSEEEDNEEDVDPDTEFQLPKFHSQSINAVRMFCGPSIGFVLPWKSQADRSDILEVCGHRIRGHYLPNNYDQLQVDLDNSFRIQHALTIQKALLKDMLWEVQEFCREHEWVTVIYEFLNAWGPKKLEGFRGCAVKDYIALVTSLNVWHTQVSEMSVELLTKGKLLLLSCQDIQRQLKSGLDKIRRDLLRQVQDECWKRSKKLISDLNDYVHIFQTISSDIHTIARCSQKLNEANEQYTQLETRTEYVRSLHELLRSYFNLFSGENEALDVSLLEMWETFQFEKSQATEFLLSKQHSILPKLQQLMSAAVAELEDLLDKALSDPFMDPTQDQRSTEQQLVSLEHQYETTTKYFKELRYAYLTLTGQVSPISLPALGTHPILMQQRIWHLYRVISENLSEWKCLAFAKFNLSMAQEKTDIWLTEAARMSSTLGVHSPVLQRCMRILEEFRSYLPLLTKLSSLHPQSLNCQSLFRALGLGNLHNMELLTLGQLLACSLLEFADRINQIWQLEKEQMHAQGILQQLQQYWEARQLRLLNFILNVPYEPPESGHPKKQALRRPQWEVVRKDSSTFILSDYNNLQDSIQESLQTLFKMLAIHKSGQLHKTALEWVTIMHSLSALLEVWVTFQQKWIFLNKVLHEMKIQFPNADLHARFKTMDDQYRTLMHISIVDPTVLSLIIPSAKRSPYYQGQHLQQMLQSGSVELESIIMALESVLYEVCAHFPRLFFLSNSELVALLATPLEPYEAQPWVQRCFPHVHSVSFLSKAKDEKNIQRLHQDLDQDLDLDQDSDQDQDQVQQPASSKQTQLEMFAVLGADGEEVKLLESLPLHPDIPKWLATLEKYLRSALVSLLQDCVAARLALSPSLECKKLPQQSQLPLQQNVHNWLDLAQAFPWQCIVVAEEIVWRAEMEEALLEPGPLNVTPMHMHKVEVLVQFLRTRRSSQRRKSYLPSVRQVSLLSALLVVAISHRDIAQLLEKHQVNDLKDFHWARQLKYHLGPPHLIPESPLQNLKTVLSTESSLSPAACWVDVLGRSVLYNYEYMGPRLGPLPGLLPERPMLSLILALEQVACGTLLGSDDIGKTEIINSLARALGRQLVMMFCLPQIHARCLSSYLNGALQCGAWLFLEAVHHLPPGLLSALGQRLAELHNFYGPLCQEASQSISTKNPMEPQCLGSSLFEKHRVSMRLGYGCFLTMRALSPALPANLHLLLRPVALALPDLQRVAELALLGAGVRDASRLAARLSKFFSLEWELAPGPLPCRLPLLKQILDDMVQVLNEPKEDSRSQQLRKLVSLEEAALLRALLRSPLFSTLDELHLQNLQKLLCGVFPNASYVLEEPVAPRLTKPLVMEELRQVSLLPNLEILGSLEQLSQALSRSSGILLLGPAGSGKTTCWSSLFKIQNRLAAMENTCTHSYQPVKITHLYPSGLNSQEFLGWLEGPCWNHGIFPRLLHSTPQCSSKGSKEETKELMGIQHWIVCDGASSSAWLDSITCLLSNPPQLSLPNGQQIARPPGTFLLLEVADATGMSPTVIGRCALVWCSGEQTWQSMLSAMMTTLPRDYRLQRQTITELNHMAEFLVPATFRFLARKGATSLLQIHGQQTLCPGVAEVTSLARIFRGLLDSHLHLYEEDNLHSSDDLSGRDPMAQSFLSSKSSSLNQCQVESNETSNKHREHLLAVSSFLFALIWGFGSHLPSRLWPFFDTFMRSSISCLTNYPEPPPSASVFDLHVNTEDGTLVPFTGHYLSSRVKGNLGSFHSSAQTEQLLYVVDLLLSKGQPVLLAGEAATGKSAFVEVLVEPNHPYISNSIHPAFNSTHLRQLLSRGVQGQSQATPCPEHQQDAKDSLLFVLEDLHLATSDPEKSCLPVLETLRQAMDGTVYAHNSLELQTLQPLVNFLATITVPGCSERPLCPRLFRLFTVLALSNVTLATMLSRHAPNIQAWLERFPSVEREGTLARALVRASIEAWEAVSNHFKPSPLHPHYRFSLHSVSQLLGSLQLLPTRMSSGGLVDSYSHQEHLRRVSGLRGTRLAAMTVTRNMVRLWLHEAHRTFCDRLDSHRERDHCSKMLLKIAQEVFCCGMKPQHLGSDHAEEKEAEEEEGEEEEEDEEEEEERVPEVESEGELAQWEDLNNSETDEEEDPYSLQATTSSRSTEQSHRLSKNSISKESPESKYHKTKQDEGTRASIHKQLKKQKIWWKKINQKDVVSPLLLPVLLLRPRENPSDLVFSQKLILGANYESPNSYLEREWENLEEQLATTAATLGLNPHLARCHSLTQHVARLVRVLAKPHQHGLLLSRVLGTGRHTAITLATRICQAHLFCLPFESEEAILQCLRDASWQAGVSNQPVALVVPKSVNITTLYRLMALATSGTFPDQYTEADLDYIEDRVPRELLGLKYNIKKEVVLHRFFQQVCCHLHMFFLIEDGQAPMQLPSPLLLRLLQLASASIDRYEPWDHASLVKVAQYYLESAKSPPLDDKSLKCPDLQASIPSIAKAMALIHLSASYYHAHLCPSLPLVTPRTFLDFLDTFMLQQQQMTLKMKARAYRLHNAVENLRTLVDQHSVQTSRVLNLEQELKCFHRTVGMLQHQLDQSKLQYRRQLAECRHQENLIDNLIKQRDALQAHYDAFLEQMGKAFLGPLSQLQVSDFEEIRSYRAPPEPVVRVTNALCDLFHRETGWTSAKQLLCTDDFYQELVFFPKEKLTDSELMKLKQTLSAPGMSDAELRVVSIPTANLAIWLWAVLHYGMAQRRGLPTSLLLQQVEATLVREEARLGHYQFLAQELLDLTLDLAKKLEEAQDSYNRMLESLNQAHYGQYHEWPIKSALLTPMHTWTMHLQKLRELCMTMFGDALLCSAAIIYLGPFPPPRRREMLEKWLALCRGFQEALGPDDVAQALKQKSVIMPPKVPLLPTRCPFRILSLLSCEAEQFKWDRDQKPQARSARLIGLLLRSRTHYYSCRWPLLLDSSKQALTWLDPLPMKENICLSSESTSTFENTFLRDLTRDEEDTEDDESEEEDEAEEQTESKEEESETQEQQEQEETVEEEQETATQSQEWKVTFVAEPLPPVCLYVLSGADPELGLQLREAAANGQPVLLTSMELGLECWELQWLLQRDQLRPPEVQPGFCLYLSTTLPLNALENVLGCELLKGMNVLDLGINMDVLEEQMLHEILCREAPELKKRWQDLQTTHLDTCEAVKVDEERLLTALLYRSTVQQKPSKFLRDMVRVQAKICQLQAQVEELEEQKTREIVLWVPYQQVVWHGMAIIEALSSLQNLLPLFHMSPENWLAATKRALNSMQPYDSRHGEDLASHLLKLKRQLTRCLLRSTTAILGLTHVPLVGALGALALLSVRNQAPKLERLALWPGLTSSFIRNPSKSASSGGRPAWLALSAWQECAVLERLAPFTGLRASLAEHPKVWQDYLSLSSTVLGPAPGLRSEPLSLFQKLILWRVLRPQCLAAALADLTTSLLGQPLDENLSEPIIPFEHSQPTQPILILLPPPSHPTALGHPLTFIQKLAAIHTQKQVQVIALGSDAWDPVSVVISSLCQAMVMGYWLVLDNCHLMPHWPRDLLQPLLNLLDGATVVSDKELEAPFTQPDSRTRAIVHRGFRLWLIVSTEAKASLPDVLTQHSLPIFWDQSLELNHILINNVELAQQESTMQPPTQIFPLLLLHGLLLHRQLYGMKLQAHRGRWSQLTLTQVLQIQNELWASLSNPNVAMQELAASIFYGGALGDTEDTKAQVSLTQACLSPSNMSGVQPHTPQYLLATLMPSPDLGKLDAMAEFKAQIHLLPTPSEPGVCGLSEASRDWLLQRRSQALLHAMQQCSTSWVPAAGQASQQAERRLRQRLVQIKGRLESLENLLTKHTPEDHSVMCKLGPHRVQPLQDFLQNEVLELSQLVVLLQRDLDCLLQQLKGKPPCSSRRCTEVAQALWAGQFPRPWRCHAPPGLQPPWQWLRQLSRRGQQLIVYLGKDGDEGYETPQRIFHLSAFGHPRRLLLALRWEATLAHTSIPASQGSGSRHNQKELNHLLHLRVENGPNPTVPELGLLLIGLQVLHAKWDSEEGALLDTNSTQPSPLPPVSIRAQAPGSSNLPAPDGLAVYRCPVYMAGPLGITKLNSRNILMYLPLPTKLSPDTCVLRRVHVCSPPLP